MTTGLEILGSKFPQIIGDKTAERAFEVQRLTGVLLGLEIAKKDWGEGNGFLDFMENIKYYKEELQNLLDEDK